MAKRMDANGWLTWMTDSRMACPRNAGSVPGAKGAASAASQRLPSCRLLFCLILVSSLLPAAAAGASAQGNSHSLGSIGFGNADYSAHTPAEHMVQGVVADKAGKPVSGAIVHLKNARNHEVNMVIADEKGAYRFSPLQLKVE